MDIREEIKKLKEGLANLEKQVADNCTISNIKDCTISNIKVGEKFVYCGHNYTKLNEENFCIIDDYDEDFMRCIFDPMTNNYDESLIRQYINSDRFVKRLGVNPEDIVEHYKNDKITLLSVEEYNEYGDLISDYDCWWATRSANSYYTYTFCIIYSSGGIYDAGVSYTYGVRLGFRLTPNTPVDRKGNEENEEMGEDE